jgi:hypothetical protein
MKATLKINPLPRCPDHKTEMVPATHWLKLNGRPFPKPVYVCDQTGCLYVYNIPHGYYKALENEPIGRPLTAVLPGFNFWRKD